MAVYCNLHSRTNSAAQHPEYLYRNKLLMVCVVSCSIAMLALLKYDIPALNRIFTPTLPVRW